MAAASSRGGDSWVLGGRHILGIFVLLVVLFGFVFTLGYLLGRSQYDARFRGISGPDPERIDQPIPKTHTDAAAQPAEAPPASSRSDWEFFHSADPERPAAPIPEPAKPEAMHPVADKPPAASPVGEPALRPVGSIKVAGQRALPRGTTVLQVAAFTHQSDAQALAKALQQKKYPAFVLTPTADQYYRVQVGPYEDSQSAANARKKLESQGFKTITRR